MILFLFMHLSVSMCVMCVQFLWRSEEGTASHRVGITGVCELPDVDAGSLQEQQTCLNAESSLQFTSLD